MRYTEARLHKMAEEMLADLDKDTVDSPITSTVPQGAAVLPSVSPTFAQWIIWHRCRHGHQHPAAQS